MEIISVTMDETDNPPFLTWRMVADQLAAAFGTQVDEVIYIGQGRADALRNYEILKADDAESNMIAHARRELVLLGQYEEDPEFSESLIAAVAEFTHYGHSGGSHFVSVAMLQDLLCYRPLAPLTSDPDEWQDVTDFTDATSLWQNRRDGRCFSYDMGKTWYNIEDPRWRHARHWWNFRARWWRHKVNKLRISKQTKPLPEPEVDDG